MILSFPPLIPEELLERAKKLNASLLCDGIAKAGLPIPNGGCMDGGICALDRSMFMVGTAMTVEPARGDNYSLHLATYSAPGPGYVMVVAGGCCTERAYLGELVLGAAKAVGFAGVVVDGLIRDSYDIIHELDAYPTFSRGTIPRGPAKKSEGSINAPVVCGGLNVAPGDLVVGDGDGVAVVPREHIETVLAFAEEKARYEKKRKLTIAEYSACQREGRALPELAPQWVIEKIGEAPSKGSAMPTGTS